VPHGTPGNRGRGWGRRTAGCRCGALMETSNRWTRAGVAAVFKAGVQDGDFLTMAYVAYVSGAEESTAAAAAMPMAPPIGEWHSQRRA
jgi:hypothetical protein